MKKFLEKYYYIPKHTAVPESNALGRIGISIAIIILCLIAMSASALAFFSHNISSAKTQIVSATYSLQVTKAEGNDAVEENGYFLIENNTGDDEKYEFTIATTDNTTASVGYCKIVIVTDPAGGNGEEVSNEKLFYTEPIWKQGTENNRSSIDVSIAVPSGKSVTVQFISEWGSCSKDIVENGATIAPFAPRQSEEQNGGSETEPPKNNSQNEEPSGENTQNEEPSGGEIPEEEPSADETDESTENTTENTEE